MACTGHKKGGHSGAPKAKHKGSAKKACAVKLKQKAKQRKSDIAYIKKIRGH